MVFALLIAGLLGPAEPPPSTLRCTATYADEPVIVDVAPVADPYRVEAVPVGRRFAFKAVWAVGDGGRGVLDLYAYRVTKTGNVLQSQVKLREPFPQAARDAPFGFTGLHLVYEPDLGSELRFWCAWVGP